MGGVGLVVVDRVDEVAGMKPMSQKRDMGHPALRSVRKTKTNMANVVGLVKMCF